MKDNQAKYPQLRFKGFTDPWEKRRLSDMVLISKDKNTDNQFGKNEVVSVSREAGTVNQIEYQGRSFAANDVSNYKKIKLGDLVYTKSPLKGAPYGIFQYATIVGIVSPLYAVYHSTKKSFAPFVALQLRDDNIASHYLSRIVTKGAKNTINVTDTDALDGYLNFPNRIEQQKIFDFFQKLDNLITLNQRKLAKLKELKQGYLQKMFPQNGSKFPQLRFAGFADAWEQRKLSNLAERVTRKNKNNESGRPLTISAQDGLIDQNDFFDKQIASRDVSGYFLVKNGEFAYNKSYSNGYPWGAIKRLDKYDMGVLSTLYIIFRPTNVSSQFLVSYYDTTRWYKEVAKNAAEGARNHGLLNIAPTDFFSTVLIIPNSIEEQQKIGSFFKQLDDTITLHQRKLEKLQELKKGYLQKMFC
ncbi:restriction endonuclease subunit S [Furfurilactobacillus curtus]|uniref:Type I restriction modification DNA specificity domain-containing protein n=1 Tax=Furfurilactobacillus curtus TaxID=1746200 RepID=A0ABQ5JPZ7_9LACO